MKNIILILVLFTTTMGFSSPVKKSLYQVISAHPHDVKNFFPYVKTVKEDGRLWLVELQDDAPSQVLKYLRATNGSDVRAYYPLIEKSFKKNSPVVEQLISKIKMQEIQNEVKALSQYKTRLTGTPENRQAAAHIEAYFKKLGYVTSQVCHQPDACSVIADKKSSTASSEVIMIMAHFDSVGKSLAGADDNGSGTAVMMEIARVLKDYDNKKNIRFFATNGEEQGLYGAEHYARVLSSSGEIKDISLAINMDMVGYNANGVVELETDAKFEDLANKFAVLAANYTKLKSKITIGAWGSDHVPFIQADVPTLLTIEDWSTKTPCYHQSCDKPDTLNYSYATEIAKLNLAAMVTEDIR